MDCVQLTASQLRGREQEAERLDRRPWVPRLSPEAGSRVPVTSRATATHRGQPRATAPRALGQVWSLPRGPFQGRLRRSDVFRGWAEPLLSPRGTGACCESDVAAQRGPSAVAELHELSRVSSVQFARSTAWRSSASMRHRSDPGSRDTGTSTLTRDRGPTLPHAGAELPAGRSTTARAFGLPTLVAPAGSYGACQSAQRFSDRRPQPACTSLRRDSLGWSSTGHRRSTKKPRCRSTGAC